jgi:serine/threonine protein phosphatase PrpC
VTGLLQAGGFVTDGRVNGSLNLSRALGDMEYKQSADLEPADQIVTAVPEVRPEPLHFCFCSRCVPLACERGELRDVAIV